MIRRIGFFLLLLLVVTLLGCRQAELAPVIISEQVVQSQPTMTATLRPSLTPSTTPTPANTATPSVTPSPTPTPTATAVAAAITRLPNSIGRQEPQPQGGAPCGLVDVFDFPIEPPSVEIRAGACVRRGEKLANIGQPRTPPHLHWEIRTHMPYQPGPGYWPEDPTTAGWIPPSQTVWQQRMAAQPHVAWIRPLPEEVQFVGTLNDQQIVWMANNSLHANNLSDGRAVSMSWPRVEHENEGRSDALVLPDASLLYTVDDRGHLFQYANTAAEGTAVPDYDLQWELELESRGSPLLHALPGGGVLVTMRTRLWGISPEGELLWMADVAEWPSSWTHSDEQIIFTTRGDEGATWQVRRDQPPQKIADITGLPVLAEDNVWIYAQNDLYKLDLADNADTAVSVYTFPSTFFPRSGIAALPDGGVVLAHSDRFDQRLLAFNADGSLRWERSFAALRAGNSQLLQLDGRPYLVTWQLQGSSTTLVDVYELEMETAVLTHIFSGGTRTGALNSWALAANDNQLLLSINNSLVAVAITPAATD